MGKERLLLIIDVQKDFCPGGALGIENGDEIVPVLNAYIELFMTKGYPVFVSRDWHPDETPHFKSSGGDWPHHCVRETAGADFHPGLQLPSQTVILSKGFGQEDGYSAFEGQDDNGKRLESLLRTYGVSDLFVGGLATDYCVKNTVLDALARGFTVNLLQDGVRGVELQPGDTAKAVAQMQKEGAKLLTLDQVKGDFR